MVLAILLLPRDVTAHFPTFQHYLVAWSGGPVVPRPSHAYNAYLPYQSPPSSGWTNTHTIASISPPMLPRSPTRFTTSKASDTASAVSRRSPRGCSSNLALCCSLNARNCTDMIHIAPRLADPLQSWEAQIGFFRQIATQQKQQQLEGVVWPSVEARTLRRHCDGEGWRAEVAASLLRSLGA